MEILFFLISILSSISLCYLIGRIEHSHSSLIRAYKSSNFLLDFHLLMVILLTMVLFITLCAFNNTFWHLPYYSK